MKKSKITCTFNNKVYEFESITSASNYFNIPKTTIVDAIRDNRSCRGILFTKINKDYVSKGSEKVIENLKDFKPNNILSKIAEIYSEAELQAIANGCRILPSVQKTPTLNFDGQHIKIGVMSDTHLGSVYTSENYLYKAFEEFKKEKVDFMCHAGDVTEGMSNRPGHIFELSHIGYDKQKSHAIDVLSQCPCPAFYIDGNHDRWYIKSNGALMVKDICDAIPNATFLGHDEGDINVNNIKIRLWHGEDGNSYATSYRIQKVVESLSGGDKPNVMFLGHTHKQAYIFERNIQCVSAGSMQKQSGWMRGKRIAAHVGFHIVDIWTNKKGVSKFRVQWYPIY